MFLRGLALNDGVLEADQMSSKQVVSANWELSSQGDRYKSQTDNLTQALNRSQAGKRWFLVCYP